MSREAVINTWCDLHPEEAAVGEVTIIINRKPRLVDVCDADFETLQHIHAQGIDPKKLPDYAPLRPKVVEEKAKPPSRTDIIKCPRCDEFEGTRHNLSSHLRQRHAVSIKQLVADGEVPAIARGRRKAA